MYKDLVFLSFFDIVENSEFIPEESIEFLKAFENKALGYRDAIFLSDQQGICTLLGDMSPVSRLDSYVTNMKMFWEKEAPKEIVFSVGLFETIMARENETLSFIKGCNFSFKYQSICLAFSPILSMFAIGLDNGHISFYKTDGNRLDKLVEMSSMKVHNKRVMGVAFDGLKGLLFSISEDGFMQVVDPIRKQILGCEFNSDFRVKKTMRV